MKIRAIALSSGDVMAKTAVPTSIQDLTVGLKTGLSTLEEQIGEENLKKAHKLACSSAAGGLRMVAIGLVPDLTVEAARQAALGGGARVLKTFSYQLTDEDVTEIGNLKPDIILLAGGTDGGNHDNILANAKRLASLGLKIPVIIAGNRNAAAEVAGILSRSFDTYITDNVMPQIGQLKVEPAREVIRQVFMEKIVFAKGFSKVSAFIDGIVMPTPAAVLKAGQLLSHGVRNQQGWGDLIVVDVGGATTDIHSFSDGRPTNTNVVMRGLPEPYAKRTVEGDLGVRVSAMSLVDSLGKEEVARRSEVNVSELESYLRKIEQSPKRLPENEREERMDIAFGFLATQEAMKRHVGKLTQVFAPTGPIWIQEGKDLSSVKKVVLTGGVFVHSPHSLQMAGGVISSGDPMELRPKSPKFYLDKQYVMAAAGLLSESFPEVGLKVLNKSLEGIS